MANRLEWQIASQSLLMVPKELARAVGTESATKPQPPGVRLRNYGAHTLSADDCRLLVEGAADYAIFMLDPDGHVVSWNLGAERIKGYTADEIIGQHFSKFFPPEDIERGKPERELATALEMGRTEDEGWRVRKDGTRFWANVVLSALRDEHGDLRGFGKVTRDLTDKRAAMERLRQSEQRFHDLVDAVSDYAIFMLDQSGHVTTWNEGAKRCKGYESHEIVGKHFSVFYTPEDLSSGKPERILDTVRQKGRYEEEGYRVRKDGTRFWANVVITPLRTEDGRVTGFAKVTRDLTERKKADELTRQLIREQAGRAAAEASEARIRESEERYRDLSRRLEIILEGVAEGITVQDKDGRVIFANSAAAKLSGFDSVDEFLRAPVETVLRRFEVADEFGHPFDLENLPARRILRGEPAGPTMLHVRERATRREWWTVISATGVANAEGTTELAINVWREVTADRRQEYEARYLAEATNALSFSLDESQMLSGLACALVPAVGDWCAVHLLSGDELRSAALVHSDGQKADRVRALETAYPPDRRGPLWEVLNTGTPQLFANISDEMLIARARDANHLKALRELSFASIMHVPLRTRDRVVGVLTVASAESERLYEQHDILFLEEVARRASGALENARLYRAAQEAAVEAAAAAKRAEEANRIKDEFLATVSHELRTPLNAIVGWSAILRQRELDAFLEKAIEVIDRNAQAQGKIIDDILDVSRIITGKFRIEPKPASLVDITRNSIEVIRPSAVAKDIAVEFTPPSDPCLLVGDPERLQQVVWNLLSNAVKFTEPNGCITIQILNEGGRLELCVTDTGRGIESDLLPYVFDRFKQGDASTTRRVGGLGLGLALVRHIVELHGGSVAAESAGPDQGASFRILLPVRAIAPSAPSPKPAERDVVPRAALNADKLFGLRVLVVDDDADARDLLHAVLTAAGAAVETAPSAAEGLRALQRFRPQVLVSDIAMADEDGYSFVRKIRQLDPRDGGLIPSVALTAYTRAEDRSRALAAGFTTHIGKPVNPDDLVAAVANLAGFART